jgi:nitroreductase
MPGAVGLVPALPAAPSIQNTGRREFAMGRRFLVSWLCAVGAVLAHGHSPRAQDLTPISLPAPVTEGGKPLLTVLKARASAREFAPEALSSQTLSNLLWAAWGINRPDGRRTAPSASNKQEVDIYVVRADGAYLWDAAENRLLPVAPGDHRALTGTQPFPAASPLNLVYVADLTKVSRPATDPQQAVNLGADAGFIAENVYLFCASEGLATVVRASVPREALAAALKLRPTQLVVLAQTVGYLKK